MQISTATEVPSLSATTKLLKNSPFNDTGRYNVALQVQHNLQYQQQWTSLTIHASDDSQVAVGKSFSHLSHPIISGLPPTRLYVHPDEMVAHVTSEQMRKKNKHKLKEQALQHDKIGTPNEKGTKDKIELKDNDQNSTTELDRSGTESVIDIPQREWIIPTRVHEPWSLSRLAAIFDNIESVPPEPGDEENATVRGESWPRTKRAIMAIVDDDSTVVYYIIHEGLIKPRQN